MEEGSTLRTLPPRPTMSAPYHASYQHSNPGETLPLIGRNNDASSRSHPASRFTKVCLTTVFLLLLVLVGRSSPRVDMLAAEVEGPPPSKKHSQSKPKDLDWDKIKEQGKFDWEKCKESKDPNCWKEEGQRVHSYWKDFGAKMKSYWQSVRDFFAPKKPEPSEEGGGVTEPGLAP